MSRTGSKPLIAIVDDDASVCRAIKRFIRSLGMEADTFSSGHCFLERIDATPSFRPDCVILDVQMVGMNGLEVQERLRTSGLRLPIIFITAYDEAGVRDRALGAGAIEFLLKPVNDELFIRTLRVALKPGAGKEEKE